jgi:hypothetical protein
MAGVAEDADIGLGEACLLFDRGDLVIAVVESESFVGEGALRDRGMFWRIWQPSATRLLCAMIRAFPLQFAVEGRVAA